MENVVFSPIPLELLKTELTASFKKEFDLLISKLQPAKEHTQFLSRKEAAKFLGISLPTLDQWTKQGAVTGYRIATTVRYKLAELEASASEILSRKNY